MKLLVFGLSTRIALHMISERAFNGAIDIKEHNR